MARRSSGEGHVRKRADGSWEARLPIPGRKPKSFYAQTQAEAIRKRAAYKAGALDAGLNFDADKLTFGEYVMRWLHDAIAGSVKERSFDRYEGILRVHVAPDLGSIRLSKLTALHLSGFYREKLNAGLSAGNVAQMHSLIKRALRQAVRWHLLAKNPAEDVDPPRKIKGEEIRYLTPSEVAALFEAVRGERLEALFVVAVLSGLRVGELLGLCWEDVDLDKGSVRVRRQLVRPRSGLRFGTPKREASRRSVSIRRTAVDALRRHRARQLEERLAAGSAWRGWPEREPADLVFTRPGGGAIDPSAVTRVLLLPALKRAGLMERRIRFHDFRHTFATLMLVEVGERVSVVSKMMGHAKTSETLDTYGHLLPDAQEQAAERLDGLF